MNALYSLPPQMEEYIHTLFILTLVYFDASVWTGSSSLSGFWHPGVGGGGGRGVEPWPAWTHIRTFLCTPDQAKIAKSAGNVQVICLNCLTPRKQEGFHLLRFLEFWLRTSGAQPRPRQHGKIRSCFQRGTIHNSWPERSHAILASSVLIWPPSGRE